MTHYAAIKPTTIRANRKNRLTKMAAPELILLDIRSAMRTRIDAVYCISDVVNSSEL